MFIVFACNPADKISSSPSQAVAPVFIYKTRNNYLDNVPVILSGDKKSIVSYPHPTDLKTGDTFLKPVRLKNGYLLDKKGINENVAFLKLTYEEYSKLNAPPDIKELRSLILDDDPLTELYYCGKRSDFDDIVKQLNREIKKGNLNTFKRLK
jgi:hypothetical protein